MAINKAWHEKHVMPKHASFEQRMEWHIAHLKHCACYPVSDKLREEMKLYVSAKKRMKR